MADEDRSPREARAERFQPVTNRDSVDPHNVPVTFVDGINFANLLEGIGYLTLTSAQCCPHPEGGNNPDVVVAARLRFSLSFATQLRDVLDKIVLAATPPEGSAH